MHTAHDEPADLQSRAKLPAGAVILDLVMAAFGARLAAYPLVDQEGVTGLAMAEAGLGILGGILLIYPRTAWAARIGEVASVIFVVLWAYIAIAFPQTCRGAQCIGVPIVIAMGVIFGLVGVASWFVNHSAYRRLSGGGGTA